MNDGVLTPDLVRLLRHLQKIDVWTHQDYFAKALAISNEATEITESEMRGWRRAVRYGLIFLAHHGLVNKRVDTSVTYHISDRGIELLGQESVQRTFKNVFEEELKID